jgi:hypothetical protein
MLLRTAADLAEGYRRRIAELGLTYATVDAISGLPDGYTAKLLSPKPGKNMSRNAIELLNGALAIGFVVTVDPEQEQRVCRRWVKRKRPFKSSASASRLSISTIIVETPVSQAQMELVERMKMLGRIGGKASAQRRMKTMGKRARQRVASHAARIRWAKHREQVTA